MAWAAIIHSVDGKIRISNSGTQLKILWKHEHFGQVLAVSCPTSTSNTPCPIKDLQHTPSTSNSDTVTLNPDGILSTEMTGEFLDVLTEYDSVFSPTYKGYNGSADPFQATVHMGPIPT